VKRYRVQAAPRSHYGWLVQRTGCALTSDFRAIEAMDGRGDVRGMVGYCNWTKAAVQLHIAVEAPSVWRALLRPALEYPFVERGQRVLLGLIAASNKRSARFARAVGFRDVARIRDGWDVGEDFVLFQLRREDCRFVLSDERKVA
jgi:RimJ/RimL family protein N-acetyltransferase